MSGRGPLCTHRNSIRRGAFAAAASVAVLGWAPTAGAVPTHPSAGGKDVVPKGTPYAAEVRITINGTAKLSQDITDNGYSDCSYDGGPSTTVDNEHYELNWKATFPHVTVPVATKEELGRAYRRLHVEPKPTADGTGGLTGGSFNVSGRVPYQDQAGCPGTPYSSGGSIADPDRPYASQDVVHIHKTDVDALGFFLSGGAMRATPESYEVPDGYGGTQTQDVLTGLGSVESQVPPNPADTDGDLVEKHPIADWNAVALSKRVGFYHGLVHEQSLPASGSYKGNLDCGSVTDFGKTTCQVLWDYEYDMTLHLIALHKTRNDYPR
jgi:hypothetical protein